MGFYNYFMSQQYIKVYYLVLNVIIIIIIIIASTYKAPLTQKGSLGAVQIRVLKDILWWIYNIKSYIKTTTYRNT